MAMPANHSCSDVHGQAVMSTIAEKNVDRKICALDFDTLECPVCCELLSPPVYQCQNGHTACADCCKRLTRGLCPSRSLPIGANRCIVVEKIIESLLVNCKHSDRGCKKMVPYTKGMRKRDDHEDLCALRPYQCPVGGCKFESEDTYFLRHFDWVHNGARLLELWPGDDEMKGFFTLEAGDGEYDQPLTQFVIVHVFKNCDGSEDRDDEDQIDKGESIIRMFLVHHRFRKGVNMHSFSCTPFGASNTLTQYHLSVDVKNGRFKVNHNISGPILDNQEDNSILDNVVQRGDCLLVPACKGISFEVEFFLFQKPLVHGIGNLLGLGS